MTLSPPAKDYIARRVHSINTISTAPLRATLLSITLYRADRIDWSQRISFIANLATTTAWSFTRQIVQDYFH